MHATHQAEMSEQAYKTRISGLEGLCKWHSLKSDTRLNTKERKV